MFTTINTHDLGDLVRVEGVFSDAADSAAFDPDVVNVTIKEPDDGDTPGTVTTYVYGTDVEVIKDAVGEYHMDVDANASGKWYYRWFSTGEGQAAQEKCFSVREANALGP